MAKRKKYFKFGVEYTFVPTKRKAARSSSMMIADDGRAIKNKLNAWCGGNDSGAMEIPSKPMTCIEKHKKWATRLFRAARRRGYTPRRVDKLPNGTLKYFGTGGGHIHVQMPRGGTEARTREVQTRYICRMTKLYLHHPFIGWFMNEFMDDDNAVSIQARAASRWDPSGHLEAARKYAAGFVSQVPGYNPSVSASRAWQDTVGGYGDVGIMPRTNHRNYTRAGFTLEFRFFDAPRTIRQAEEHIALAKAMHEVGLGRKSIPAPLFMWASYGINDNEWKRASKDVKLMKREWNRFIRALGLDPKRYAKYYRNYLDRRDFGVLN